MMRRRGRPKGLPKTGGRKKGVTNKTTAELSAYSKQFNQEAIDGLVAIARNPDIPPQARVGAWKEVLDRGNGRPPQAFTGEGGGPLQHLHRVVHEETHD